MDILGICGTHVQGTTELEAFTRRCSRCALATVTDSVDKSDISGPHSDTILNSSAVSD